MLRVLTSFCIAASLSFALPSGAIADDKAQIKKDFDAWYAKTDALFESNWAGIQAAEAAAKPHYDKGINRAKAGKTKDAIAALLKARAILFNGKGGELVHAHNGLSYKIAFALAEQYEKLGDTARLKREIFFMDESRDWMPKKDEKQAFLFKAVKEVFEVWNFEEYKNKGGQRMKSKERKRLSNIAKYVAYPAGDMLFEDGDKKHKAWEDSRDKGLDIRAKGDYADFGGQDGITAHDPLHPARVYKKNNVVLIINKTVTKASGKKFELDFTKDETVPTNCKSTGKVFDITPQGRYIYKKKCSFSKRKGGHKLVFTAPKGLKLKKGDLVTMYARVSKDGKNKKPVNFDTPAVVHSSRKGKTQWLLGVKTSKAAHIVADGDYHIHLFDDSDAPPTVR